MAAGNWIVYDQAKLNLGEAAFNLSTGTFVLILATTAYVPAVTTDATYANVSADEVVTGGGYTVGGIVLPSLSWSVSGATATFTSAAAAWSAATFTLRYGVIINRAGASLVSTDKLFCYSDLGGGSSITNGGATFTVQMNASGIVTLT